ncbi:MAG: hypothetical protein U9Q90_05235 [Campylobacterota bacterium]|nr:hypothetical protein [Campylobacterota bacterium]
MIADSKLMDHMPMLKNKVLHVTDKKIYLFERYGINFTGMFVYSNETIDASLCESHIRKSDSCTVFDNNLLFITYDVVDIEDSIKAAQNLLLFYQEKYHLQELYMVVSPAYQEETAMDMGSSLVRLLDYAIKESLKNKVICMPDMA